MNALAKLVQEKLEQGDSGPEQVWTLNRLEQAMEEQTVAPLWQF